MPIPADFGSSFWVFDPLNVVGYCKGPKRHSRGQKHACWRIVVPIGQEMRSERAMKKAQKKKKKLRDVISRIFAQITHVALSPAKVYVGWGPGRCQSFHQNRFRGFGSLKGQNLPFS